MQDLSCAGGYRGDSDVEVPQSMQCDQDAKWPDNSTWYDSLWRQWTSVVEFKGVLKR
jgi:hypothetical protein